MTDVYSDFAHGKRCCGAGAIERYLGRQRRDHGEPAEQQVASSLDERSDIQDERTQVPGVAALTRATLLRSYFYSITSSAVASSVGGIASPSARAVLRLTVN